MKTQLPVVRALIAGAMLTGLAARSFAQTTQPGVALNVGDAAPKLAVAAWVKGTPIAGFEPGKVYVVEFWATWCGPCKEAIPHLTELSKKYADKAAFIGCDILEHTEPETDAAIDAKVRPFVASMGDKMDYHIAVDSAAGTMAATWMDAAGQQGIPATFVIDGAGELAWIGHPLLLEPVLQQIIAGTWDVAAERKKSMAAMSVDIPRRDAYRAITKAVRRKDPAAILAACDAAVKVPGLETDNSVMSYRLIALLDSDPATALAYVKALTASGGAASTPATVQTITRVMPEVDAKAPMTVADFKRIVAAVDPIISPGASKSGQLYADYSELLSRAGERDAAIFYQRKSVNLTIADTAKHVGVGDAHETYYVETLKKRQARLDALVAGAGQVSDAR